MNTAPAVTMDQTRIIPGYGIAIVVAVRDVVNVGRIYDCVNQDGLECAFLADIFHNWPPATK